MSSGTPNYAITGPIRPVGIPVNHPLSKLAIEYSLSYFSGQYFLSASDTARFKTNTKFHLDMTYVMGRRLWESEKDAEERRVARFTRFFYPLVEWAILRRSTIFKDGEYRLLPPDQVNIYAENPGPLPRPRSVPVDSTVTFTSAAERASAEAASVGVVLSAEDLDLLDIGQGFVYTDNPPRLPRAKNEQPAPRVKKAVSLGVALFRKKHTMSSSVRRDKLDDIKKSSSLRSKTKHAGLKISIAPSASSSNAPLASQPSPSSNTFTMSSPLSSPVSISFSASGSSQPAYSSPPSSPMAVELSELEAEYAGSDCSDSDYPYGTDFSLLGVEKK